MTIGDFAQSTGSAQLALSYLKFNSFSASVTASSNIFRPSSTSVLEMLKAGATRITLLPQPSVSKPRSKASSPTRSASCLAGSFDLRSLTKSTPIIRPLPRTSPMLGWRAWISSSASIVYWPTSAAFARYSSWINSMVASAAAQASGFPP